MKRRGHLAILGEGDLGPEGRGVTFVGREGAEPGLEGELFDRPLGDRPVDGAVAGFGELEPLLRVLLGAEQPEVVSARFEKRAKARHNGQPLGLSRSAGPAPAQRSGYGASPGQTELSGNSCSVFFTSDMKRSASAPSTIRWSKASDSIPWSGWRWCRCHPGRVITAGCFSMVPTQRMATCGWLMIGVPMADPKVPGLVMVKVPFCTSSGDSFLRARALAEVVHRAGESHQGEFVGALDDRDDEAPVQRYRHPDVDVAPEEVRVAGDRGIQHPGCFRRLSATAFTMNDVKVRFTPLGVLLFFLARSPTMRV